MFIKRINNLFSLLGATNTDVAGFSEIDRSTISRLRKGGISSGLSRNSTHKLCHGLVLYAKEHGLTDTLSSEIGFDPGIPENEQTNILLNYLFSPDDGEERFPHTETDPVLPFHERLDSIMRIADLSNVQLARILNVDASLISRYRTGKRIPRANSELVAGLPSILYRQIQQKDKKGELAGFLRISEEKLSDDELSRFLCGYAGGNEQDFLAAEKLLRAFDSYSPEAGLSLPSLDESVLNAFSEDTRTVYFRDEGLRESVIRFLTDTIRSGSKELRLYSDQNMSWMIEDDEFRKKWAVLMYECVKKGIRIRIVHHIDRGLNEMISGIISWLPLYMSGRIDAYYCNRPNGNRFSHTFFLNPGRACISGFHTAGTEGSGIFRYDTDEEALHTFRTSFEHLLSISSPLVRILPVSSKDPFTEGLIVRKEGETDLTVPTLPFENMSILVDEKDVLIRRRNAASMSVIFSHPLMSRAFEAYANYLLP